jgi:DNA-binding IclR family transcriptional regulator
VRTVERMPEPVFTAVEIADETGVSRPTVHKRLREMQSNGEVRRKEVGSRAVVYWLCDAF